MMLQRIRFSNRKPQAYAVYYTDRDGSRDIEVASQLSDAERVADECKRDGCTGVKVQPLRWAWSVKLALWRQRRASARSRAAYDPGPLNTANDRAGENWSERAIRELSVLDPDGDTASIIRRAIGEARKELDSDGMTEESLRASLSLLPPKHFALMQHRLAGRTYHEIAAIVGADERSVLNVFTESYSILRAAARMRQAG